MANAGFNKATDIFGMGTAWAVKSLSMNAGGSVAKAHNSDNDATHRDAHSQAIAPSAEYVLKSDTTSLPALGTVVTVGTSTKVMLTQIVVKTSAGAAPTATVSGVEVESGATTGRTYSCGTIALSARHRAQDIVGFLGNSTPSTLTEATFTFSVTPSIADPKGTIVASDCSDGEVEAQYNHVSGSGSAIAAPTPSSVSQVVSAPVSETDPENDYMTVSYSVTDTLTGSEPASS